MRIYRWQPRRSKRRRAYASLLLADGVSPAYVQKSSSYLDRADLLDVRPLGFARRRPALWTGWTGRSGSRGRRRGRSAVGGSEAADFQVAGGEGGIRTPGTGFIPYNRLAIVFRACFRRVQELSLRFADFDFDQY